MELLHRHRYVLVVVALLSVLVVFVATVLADSFSLNFETYTPGTVNGQDGWVSTGAAGLDGAVFDHQIVNNSGARSLRISNAVTSGSFGNQTFSRSLVDEAGETSAQSNAYSSGSRQPFFDAQFDIASTVPNAEQPGLSVTISADRGDGARMNWLRIYDSPNGLGLEFSDYQYPNDAFTYTTLANGMDRSVPHTIRVTTALLDGPGPSNPEGTANDIVCVFVDGVLRHRGTSWESYHLNWGGGSTVTVDSLLFRTSGTAYPALAGKGFLFDNMRLTSGPIPAGLERGCSAADAEAPTTLRTTTPTGEPMPLCALYGGGSNPIVRADADPNQFCRIIAENGSYVQPAAEIGDSALINLGILQAVDVFEFNAGGERVTIFERPLTVCLQGTGSFYFRDATGQPRTTTLLPSTTHGGYTCATISHAGTIVLGGS
ncbi:MAG: hypothetical protein U0452_06180 [Anaerolineae bacterium]